MLPLHRTSSFSSEAGDRNSADREVHNCASDAECESGTDDDGSDQPPPDTTTPDPLEIEIFADPGVLSVTYDDLFWLSEKVDQAARGLDITDGCIAVTVTGDEGMTRLHHNYLGIDETTDVLTFDMTSCDDGDCCESAPDYDVQIVVCRDVAARHVSELGGESSADFNERVLGELLLYIVHGLLHTLGHDDHDESDYQVMHQREDEILEAIGVGRLFAEGCEDGECDE